MPDILTRAEYISSVLNNSIFVIIKNILIYSRIFFS